MINQIVDQRYEVVEKIGEGELFQVFRARDKATNKFVALKLLDASYAQEKGFAKEMMQIVRTVISLSHPNIAQVTDLKPHENTGFIVTEFVRGINLKERIRRIAPFGLSAAVDFAIAIAEALHYAHGMGVVHGDLRPQNVIISPEGHLKITDFGVQSAVATSSRAQKAILARAAPYHAPEVSMTNSGTMAGDLYALGSLFYEMLTGTPLYSGETLEAIADQHAFAPIPSPRAVNPGVPRAVEGIILKCLQKKPQERYLSASELLTDLHAVRDGLRFGKSLSWSPIEIEKTGATSKIPTSEESLPVQEDETVVSVAASSEAVAMPSRTPHNSSRVSVYIKAAFVGVTLVIIAAIVAIAGIYISNWIVPKAVAVPTLEGKSIEEARKIAQDLDIRLNEHPEYSEKPRNLVLRTDKRIGAEIHAKQVINVWVSRGSIYVDVPKLTGMTREEAEKKLKDVGLTLGAVTTEHDPKISEGKVIRQADKTRVLHDSPIDVVLSIGPKETVPPPITANPTPPEPNNTATNEDMTNENHDFDRVIRIGRDGSGRRKVRVDYEDFYGVHTAIDEEHDEGEQVQVNFSYTGKKIKVRIYYNDRLEKEFSLNPQSDKGKLN